MTFIESIWQLRDLEKLEKLLKEKLLEKQLKEKQLKEKPEK